MNYLKILMVALFSLTACKGQEAGLVIYSGQHKNATAELVKAFEEAEGITVSVRHSASNELAHQIAEEGARSPADIIITEETSPLFMLDGKGLLETLPQDVLALVPADYRSKAGTWAGVLARSRVIVYNPSLIEETALPASVMDLVAPEWEGRFAFVPTSGAFQAQLSAMIKLLGPDKAEAWLVGIQKTGKIYRKNTLVLDAVERGEIGFGLINHYYWDRLAMEKGKDALTSRLHFIGKQDFGAMLTVSGIAQLKGSKNKERALRFVTFALSEEGQGLLAAQSAQYPLNPNVAPHGEAKPFAELVPPPDTLDLGEFSDGKAATELLQKVGLL